MQPRLSPSTHTAPSWPSLAAPRLRNQRTPLEVGPLSSSTTIRRPPPSRRNRILVAALTVVAALALLTLFWPPSARTPEPQAVAAPLHATIAPSVAASDPVAAAHEMAPASSLAIDLPSPPPVPEVLPIAPIPPAVVEEKKAAAVESPTSSVADEPAAAATFRPVPSANVDGEEEARPATRAQRRPLRPRIRPAEVSRDREEARAPARRQPSAVVRRTPPRLAPDDPGDRETTGATRTANRRQPRRTVAPAPRQEAAIPLREETAEPFTLPDVLRPAR